ncbi:MAG: methyltransferase type 11, partial [Chloroflexi bacterium]|nr:methyltransferase type 11 [Chloroflexota bacterium]
PWVDWQLDFLVRDEDGKWRLPPEIPGELPLFFSLVAMKPTLSP